MAENVPPSKVYSSILYSFMSNKVNESIPTALKRNSSALYKSNPVVPPVVPGPKTKGNLVLYLIVKTLNLFGILGDLSRGTALKKRRNIRGMVTLFSANAFCAYKICGVFDNCAADNEEAVKSFGLFVRYLSLVYGANYAFAKSTCIVECVERLVKSDSYSPPEAKMKVKHCDQQIRKSSHRPSACFNGFVILVALLHFINWLVNLEALSHGEFVEVSAHKSVLKWAWDYLKRNLCLATFLTFCDVSFYCFLLALQFCLQALVVSMSGVLVARMSAFKNKLQFLNERVLDRLSVQHTELCEMTGEVNSVAIPFFCVWSLDALLTFLARVPAVFRGVLLDGRAVDDRVATMDVFSILTGFFVVLVSLSSVADADRDLSSVCQVRSLTTMDCTSKNQIKGAFLMSKINSASIRFTILRSFKIEKILILRAIGFCLAYLLFAVAWLERENRVDESTRYYNNDEQYTRNGTKIFINRK